MGDGIHWSYAPPQRSVVKYDRCLCCWFGHDSILVTMVFENEEMSEKPWQLSDISWQKKVILWSPIMIVSLYLVLTFVILLSSIDNIQFATHELYGAPFILAILMAFPAWAGIKSPQNAINYWLDCRPSADYGIDLGQ